MRAFVHWRPPARVQWYIVPVAQRCFVATFEDMSLVLLLPTFGTLAFLLGGTAATATLAFTLHPPPKFSNIKDLSSEPLPLHIFYP